MSKDPKGTKPDTKTPTEEARVPKVETIVAGNLTLEVTEILGDPPRVDVTILEGEIESPYFKDGVSKSLHRKVLWLILAVAAKQQ